MTIDLREAATAPEVAGEHETLEVLGPVGSRDAPDRVNPFAGGLLTVLLVPLTASLDDCLDALRNATVQAWTEHLQAPVDETVVVAGTVHDEAPSMDAIADVEGHVLGVLEAAGIEVEVRGSGYVSAEALRRWGAHAPS